MEKFLEYLQTQTNLSQRSINLYYGIIKKIVLLYGQNPNIEQMNAYIREKPLSKYAFLHYLHFLGRLNDCSLLLKARQKPKKREGVYLDQEELKKIVFSITEEKYRYAALVQFVTGVRAGEVLKLRKEDFSKENNELKITMIGKGERKKVVFIPETYSKFIYNFIINSGEYPFLKPASEDFFRNLQTNYIYYWRSIKQAASALGYDNFAPHDFRRNFIDQAYTLTKDIRVVQDLAGHARAETTLQYFKKKISEEEFKDIVKKIRG